MKIIVVGGGIGGIATALALEQRFDITVLEQAPEIADVGAGVWTTANGTKVLRHLGVEERIRETSVEVSHMSFRRLGDGEVIMPMELGAKGEDCYDAKSYFVHRADLLDSLLGGLQRTELRMDARVVDVTQDPQRAYVSLESGERLEADLVVGADGLKSVVRSCLFGDDQPRFADHVTWRAVFPYERVSDIGLVENGGDCWFGAGRSAVCYPLRSELFNFVGFVPAGEVTRESWTTSGDVTELRESFEGVCPQVAAIVDAVRDAFVTGLFFRDPLPSWRNGRVVLLGDAAHPALPTVGQGATMAIEDAVTLAGRLLEHGDVSTAIAEYEARRLPRTTRALEISRTNARIFHVSDEVQIRARDGRFKGLQSFDPVGEPAGSSLWKWMWSHDAAREAQSATVDADDQSAPGLARRRPEAQRAVELWRSILTPEARGGGWVGEREAYDHFWTTNFPLPPGFRQESPDGLQGLLISALDPGEDGPNCIYLHGGGFVMGSAAAAGESAARLAKAIGGRVFVIDYRLAPEHAGPAALEDVLAGYRWVLDEAGGADDLVVFAEGAGGGLAVALAMTARENDLVQPAGIHLVSPFCDLTLSAESIVLAKGRDPWLNRQDLVWQAASYVQDSDPRDWRLSPLWGDLKGLPPLLIHCASGEALEDDAVRLAQRAEEAGVPVSLETFDDSVHAFALFPFLPEAATAFAETAALLA